MTLKKLSVDALVTLIGNLTIKRQATWEEAFALADQVRDALEELNRRELNRRRRKNVKRSA